ncbi:MAG: hypothetical protein EXR54_09440 [Dehalococcoidia bacterium]|nr:hypothetical protein [Dehalococcoidia bacterium]
MVESVRPQALPVHPEIIPDQLKAIPQWVLWRWKQRPDQTTGKLKWTKPPYQPNGNQASSTDPSTWVPFDEALDAHQHGGFDGIGFVVTPELGIVGVDLDHCVNAQTGTTEPWAQAIVDRLGSYTEVTPSGTGLRVFLHAKLPPGGRKRGNVEMYDSGRYLTVTGHHLTGTPLEIMDRQAEIEAIHAEVFADRPSRQSRQPPPSSDTVKLDDQELIAKAKSAANGDKFGRLWGGDASGYPSESEADLALCSLLSFWTGPDAGRIDSLFRQSGLMDGKWASSRSSGTYGSMTIAKALEGATEFYAGHANGRKPPEDVTTQPDPRPWPKPLAEEAFHGLAGEVVRTIEPHTESDPAAILLDFLISFGNAVGRPPHAVAEADRHGLNLFGVLVGETSKARKGSSRGHVRELFHRADPAWADSRVMGGLSSGEGLIWAVRDPIEKTEAVKKNGKPTGEYQPIIVDGGVDDKRLMVFEPEFAGILKVMDREGNILSPLVRQAWDSGTLRTLTKNDPARATDAHISILAHVTRDELLRHLNDTEAGNGFANRFLWGCIRRSKVLPEGGGVPDYNSLVQSLHGALERGRTMGRLARDGEARKAWAEIYPELSEGKPGLFGAVTARAEAQVLRLSVLYATLDGAEAIRLPHLKAALAVWEYADASARYIFGDATGDPIADRILESLRYGELTRSSISALFQRNASASRIERALNLLRTSKLARMERRETEGRPVEVWSAM